MADINTNSNTYNNVIHTANNIFTINNICIK